MRVLIAPDKFKSTLTAAEAAAAMARGCHEARPDVDVELLPLSDGGEGFAEALVAGTGGRLVWFEVPGPLGATVTAPLALLDDGRVAVEMSCVAGLGLVPPERRDPLRASTHGLGRLLDVARRLSKGGAILVGIGGSATTDGGTGAAAATGWRFLDAAGRDLPPGGGSLRRLQRIVAAAGRWPEIVGACDVLAPLTGPDGAARRYAPQKAASPDDVEVLEAGLRVLASRLRADIGVDAGALPGAGAGGGTGAGLAAFFDARLRSGVEVVAAATGLEERVLRADLVLTGEGRLDAGSLHGKVPVGVARTAAATGVPCIAIAGEIAIEPVEAGFAAGLSLTDVGGKTALSDAAGVLARAAALAVSSVCG